MHQLGALYFASNNELGRVVSYQLLRMRCAKGAPARQQKHGLENGRFTCAILSN